MNDLISKSRKLINRYIAASKTLFKVIGVPDGLMNILLTIEYTNSLDEEDLYDCRLSYDFDYFVYAKSTKTLMAIRRLLNCDEHCYTEDCYTLIRSIFEGHLLSRNLRENIDSLPEIKEKLIKQYIMAPLGESFGLFYKDKSRKILSKDNEFVSKEVTPRSAASVFDKGYYDLFYPFLCQFSHCSFAVASDYLGKSGFTANENNGNKLLAYTLALFVYSKVFEGIITVEGEDFYNRKHMTSCYDLAYDSIELQMNLFSYLIEYYKNTPLTQSQEIMQLYFGEKNINSSNKKIAKMLMALKDALIDPQLSSLDVSEFVNGRFNRKYAEY